MTSDLFLPDVRSLILYAQHEARKKPRRSSSLTTDYRWGKKRVREVKRSVRGHSESEHSWDKTADLLTLWSFWWPTSTYKKQNRLSYIVIQSLAGPASLPVLPTSWSQYALCPRRLTGTNSLNQQPCPPLPAEFSQKASQQEKEGTEDREIRCPFSSLWALLWDYSSLLALSASIPCPFMPEAVVSFPRVWHNKLPYAGTSLRAQWLRLPTPNAGGPGFDPWSGNY